MKQTTTSTLLSSSSDDGNSSSARSSQSSLTSFSDPSMSIVAAPPTSSSTAALPTTTTTTTTPPTVVSSPPQSPNPRRIRFAPLPDPRHLVVVTEDGHELPIKDDTHFPAAASLAAILNSTSPNELLDHTLSAPLVSAPLEGCSSSTAADDHSNAQAKSPLTKSFGILNPFKWSTCEDDDPVTATTATANISHITIHHPQSKPKTKTRRKSKSLSITTEEILTLGTINLFRPSVLEESDSATPTAATSFSFPTPTTVVEPKTAVPKSHPVSKPLSEAATTATATATPPPNTKKKKKDKDKGRGSIFGVNLSEVRFAGRAKVRSWSGSLMPASSSTSSTSSGSTVGGSSSVVNGAKPTKPNTARQGARMLNGRVYGGRSKNRNHNANHNPFASALDYEPEFVEWGYGGMGSVKGAKSAGVVVGAGGGRGSGAVNWERLVGSGSVRKKRKGSVSSEEEEDDGSGLAWVRKRRREREERERKEKEKEALATTEVAAVEEDKVAVAPVTTPTVDTKEEKAGSVESKRDSSTESESGSEEGDDEEEDEDEDEDEDKEERKTAIGAGVEKVSRHRE